MLSLASCSQRETEEEVLAKIDDLVVTEAHFEAAFKKYYYQTGQAIEPSFSIKSSVLDTEFNTYVLATYAMEIGIADDAESVRQYGMIERKVFTEEYLEAEVLERLEVSEEEIRELFLRFNTKIKASHLYAPDKAGADELYKRLQAGESFEELAAESFKNPYLAKNGGDVGEFSIDEMDIAFENAAYGLEIGEISKPVKTKQGYSIIKVTDRFTTPIVTEFQYASSKNQFEVFAERRKRELETRAHLEEVLEALNVNSGNISQLWEDVVNNQAGMLTLSADQNQLQISTNQPNDLVLAQKGDYTFTLRDLKEEGYYSPQANLNRITEGYRFENFVKGLIYRDYVTSEFKKMARAESGSVRNSIKQTYLNYLGTRVEEKLREEIELTDQEMQDEFYQNKSMYDFPMMVNLARIVVESKERGELAVNDLENGMKWEDAIKKFTIDMQDLMVNGELGLQPIQSLGTHGFHLQDSKQGDIIGPLEYQTGKLMIYKVLKVEEPREAEFGEVADLVKKVLVEKKVKQKKIELIEEVKDRHNAVLNYDKLKALNIKL